MWWFVKCKLWAKKSGKGRAAKATWKKNCRLSVDELEGRWMPSASVSLGSAAGYGVLGLQNTQIVNSNCSITGNEGISQGGTLNNMAPATIAGNVNESAAGQYTGRGKLGGNVVVDPGLLSQADQDAINAAAQAAALASTQTFGPINSATTITGNGGVNVIAINGDITSTLILSGTSSDTFIVNVSGTVNLHGKSTLGLAGGVSPDHVLYNFTGASGTISTHAGNALNGTLLARNYSFSFDGVLSGEIIGGGASIDLRAGAKVNQASFVAPVTAASISGYVFDSGNGSAPLAGVTVTLSGTDVSGNALYVTTTTGSDGSYSFTNLAPGTYSLCASCLTNYTAGLASAGTANGTTNGSAGSGQISNVSLGSGDAGVWYNFFEGASVPTIIAA